MQVQSGKITELQSGISNFRWGIVCTLQKICPPPSLAGAHRPGARPENHFWERRLEHRRNQPQGEDSGPETSIWTKNAKIDHHVNLRASWAWGSWSAKASGSATGGGPLTHHHPQSRERSQAIISIRKGPKTKNPCGRKLWFCFN